ncbi:acetate--CoA ligase family protein [Desulfothermus sp.]
MKKNEIQRILKKAKQEGLKTLDESISKSILSLFGVSVVDEIEVVDIDSLKQVAKIWGYPLVLKGISKDIPHKSEMGLVLTNLYNLEDLKKAYKSLESKKDLGIEKIIAQPQIKGSREFVVGMFRDPDFGPVVMFGLGGIFTEAIGDFALRVCPITLDEAVRCVNEIRSKALLGNFRGERAVSIDKLAKILVALSDLALEFEDIKEIDINPVKITKGGDVIAVDALIGVEQDPCFKVYPDRVDPKNLRKFFYPESVVFIGASSKLGKWGHLLPTNVISGGYEGEIYLVNKRGGDAFGKKMYTSLDQLPDSIDLAVVTIPARFVIDLIPKLAKKNIHYMLLIASGFSEAGEEGKKLQQRLVQVAKENNVFIVGPNTMGLCNPHANFHCIGTLVQPRPGRTAMVSQSGNMGVQLLSFATDQGIGIRGFCGSGNEAMVCIEDYLEAFYEDDLTSTVMLYVESVKNGRRFFELAKKVSKKKPVILLKGGETDAGVKAASTHTGAMATNVKVFNTMCRQAGILKVDAPTDLLDLAASFSSLPLPKGNKVVIITLGGGWGVITADLCAKYGLKLSKIPQELIELIDEKLPDFWSRSNPIDLVGNWDIELPKTILEKVLSWGGCDAVINLGILGRKYFLKRYTSSIEKSDPTYSKDFLDNIKEMVDVYEKDFLEVCAKMMDKYEKPIFGVRLNTEPDDKTVYEIHGSKYKTVCYNSPEDAVKACARMYEYFVWLSRS